MFLAQPISEGPLDFFIPHAIDEWVQCRCEDGVKCRDYFAMAHLVVGLGPHVDDHEVL